MRVIVYAVRTPWLPSRQRRACNDLCSRLSGQIDYFRVMGRYFVANRIRLTVAVGFSVLVPSFQDAAAAQACASISGVWGDPSSILDVSISLPEQDRTAYGTIKAICQAVSAAAHVHVGVGTGVWSGGLTSDSGPVEYRLGANNEHARSVLLRALAILTPPNANTKQTWLLFYGSPQDPSYALNLMAMPGPPLKEPPAPAPPAPQPGSPSVSSVK